MRRSTGSIFYGSSRDRKWSLALTYPKNLLPEAATDSQIIRLFYYNDLQSEAKQVAGITSKSLSLP